MLRLATLFFFYLCFLSVSVCCYSFFLMDDTQLLLTCFYCSPICRCMHHPRVLMISTENLQVTHLLSHQAVCLPALSLCKVGKKMSLVLQAEVCRQTLFYWVNEEVLREHIVLEPMVKFYILLKQLDEGNCQLM